jgi:hypothetical protein
VSYKKPPIKITPSRIAIGTDTIVIADGDETYHIDLPLFLRKVPMATLQLDWHDYVRGKDREVQERIAESRAKDQK